MAEINSGVISSLWGAKKVDWKFLPAVGVAGGILVMWDNEKYNCEGYVVDRVSLLLLLKNCGSGEE